MADTPADGIEYAVALIGLAGVALGAVIAGGFQWWASRQAIAGELNGSTNKCTANRGCVARNSSAPN